MRLIRPLLVSAAVTVPLAAAPLLPSFDEFDWRNGPPPDWWYPGQVYTVETSIDSPSHTGQTNGFPFCSAPSSVTCEMTTVEYDDGFDADAISTADIDWELTIEIRDEYAWAVGSVNYTPVAVDRGSPVFDTFRVAKVGAASADDATLGCTVIVYPTTLGLPDRSCTANPDSLSISTQSSMDTIAVSVPSVHQHGDSVHIKLTATSTNDLSAIGDTVYRRSLLGPDVWIRESGYQQGSAPVAPSSGVDTLNLLGIDAVSVGADAIGSCSLPGHPGVSCEVRIDNEVISDTLPAGAYDDEPSLDLRIVGALPEGEQSLELVLEAVASSAADTAELYFTVWDASPVVTHISTSDSVIAAGAQSTVIFTVEDPGIANNGVYDLAATWAGTSAGVALSNSVVTLSDTIPDTVTVTVTGPPGGRTGVVELTATRQIGGENDSDESGTIVGDAAVSVSVSVAPVLDPVAVEVDSTETVQFTATLNGASDANTLVSLSPDCGSFLSCSFSSPITLTDGVEDTIDVSVTRTASGDQTLTLSLSGSAGGGWSGSTDVLINEASSPPPPAGPLASLSDVNPGDRFDRGSCLSVGAGPISIECDDATFTYIALPVTTYGQAWPLGIHYNSATAYGELGVAVEVNPQDSIPAAGYEVVLKEDGTSPTVLAQDTVTLPSGAAIADAIAESYRTGSTPIGEVRLQSAGVGLTRAPPIVVRLLLQSKEGRPKVGLVGRQVLKVHLRSWLPAHGAPVSIVHDHL
jgi:hypothetical protein